MVHKNFHPQSKVVSLRICFPFQSVNNYLSDCHMPRAELGSLMNKTDKDPKRMKAEEQGSTVVVF